MAILNEVTNELQTKVIYAGCQGSGKTTNLQSLFKQTTNDVSSRFFDLHQVHSKSPYFDFLPLSMGPDSDTAMRLHLYTLPTFAPWKRLRRQILQNCDGIVWVFDSRSEKLEENEHFLMNLRTELASVQMSLDDIPVVIQFNHRDSPDALSIKSLKSSFGLKNAILTEAVAVQDIGVFDAVESMTDQLLDVMEMDSDELIPHFSETAHSAKVG